jgi:hypothetical protein
MESKHNLVKFIGFFIAAVMALGLLFPAISAVYADDGTIPESQPTSEPTEVTAQATQTTEVVSASTESGDQTTVSGESPLSPQEIPSEFAETVEAIASGDPYLVRGGITYSFYTDCTGVLQDAAHVCTASTTPVQAAIDFALSGEAITIETGSYNEDVVLNKTVSLTGTGAGVTVLSFTLNADLNNASSNISAPLVYVNNGGSIQDAINLVQDGGTIQVSAGTYTENLYIDHSLTLEGANAGTPGTDSSRSAETVLQPTVLGGSTNYIIYSDADNVTIDGFTFDGTSGQSNGGAYDILVYGNGTDNFVFANNIVQNFNDTVAGDFGIMLLNEGLSGAIDSLIVNNLFQNGYRAIYTGWNDYTSIIGNTMDSVMVGMQIENNSTHMTGSYDPPIVANNTIYTNRYGVWLNLQYQFANQYTISDNVIYGLPIINNRPSYGIYVTSLQNSIGTTLNNNTVYDTTYGIGTWNTPSNLVTINGAVLVNNSVGISVDNGSYWFERGYTSGGQNPGIVHANNILVINPSVAGFQVVDNPLATGTNHAVSLFVDSNAELDTVSSQSMVLCSPSIGRTTGDNASLNISNTGVVSVVDTDGTGNTVTSNISLMGDADVDFDCIPDIIDNCPLVSNFDQLDSDADGYGDACQPVSEENNSTSSVVTTAPRLLQIIPTTGGLNELSCDLPAMLILPSEDRVTFNEPLCMFSAGLTQEDAAALPQSLPAGAQFVTAYTMTVSGAAQTVTLLPNGVSGVVSFLIPGGSDASEYALLFWDPSADQGTGEWVELPSIAQTNESGTALPLQENDNRFILTGTRLVDNGNETRVEATVNFTGTFVVVAR